MATIKNISPGIRGFNAESGLVELAPGQSAQDVEISAAELAVAKRTGWFEIDGEGDAAAEDDGDDLDVTVAKLREIAKAEDVDLSGLTAKGDIQAAIRAKRMTAPAGNSDGLDGMDDDTLRSTVQAITGKSESEVEGLDRAALLGLARSNG